MGEFEQNSGAAGACFEGEDAIADEVTYAWLVKSSEYMLSMLASNSCTLYHRPCNVDHVCLYET